MHNPNPFDFVPFNTHPFLYLPAELDSMGDRLSGYLEIEMTALTPLHVVGSLKRNASVSYSHMYQQDGAYCLPASTIRGCLRAFIEALTSGWVSQATPEYPKGYRNRHVGFSAFDDYQPADDHRSSGSATSHRSPPAIDPAFKPQKRSDGKIDVATYLFGLVIEADKRIDQMARRGKVWVEDAFVGDSDVVSNKYWLPDISGNAFMGGAKPSASNWWYLQPEEIWKRSLRDKYGRVRHVAEFVGGKFWGRKFYYHQDPNKCRAYYDKNGGRWRYSPERDFHRVWLECMEKGAKTYTFRIYVDQVPKQLVSLLMLVLMPGTNIRHKLGYGKAYGYGSVEFSLKSSWLRTENREERLPSALSKSDWSVCGWNRPVLVQSGIEQLIDWDALTNLARILGWTNHQMLLFTYPPFSTQDFMQPVQYSELTQRISTLITVSDRMTVTQNQARDIAAALFNIKKPIHFCYYQEMSSGWSIISDRKP